MAAFEDDDNFEFEEPEDPELEMELGRKDEDIYDEDGREELLDDDEIEAWEEGFMAGAEGEPTGRFRSDAVPDRVSHGMRGAFRLRCECKSRGAFHVGRRLVRARNALELDGLLADEIPRHVAAGCPDRYHQAEAERTTVGVVVVHSHADAVSLARVPIER